MAKVARRVWLGLAIACVCSVAGGAAIAQGKKPIKLLPIRQEAEGLVYPLAGAIDPEISRLIGRVTIELGGTQHYCTGLFITESVIMTAAHCVKGNGTPFNEAVLESYYKFVNFTRFAAPLAPHTLVGKCIRVPQQWSEITDSYLRIPHDYAFIKVSPALSPPPNVQLPPPTGAAAGGVVSVGFPASAATVANPNPPPVQISAPVLTDLLHPSAPAFRTESIGFTSGTSGGPWVRKPPAGKQHIISLNSSYAPAVYDTSYMRVYGPDFHLLVEGVNPPITEAQQLLTAAAGCV